MHFTQKHHSNTRPTPKAVKWAVKTHSVQGWVGHLPNFRQKKRDFSDDAAFCETKLVVLNIEQLWSIETCWLSATLKLLNYQRFLLLKYPTETQRLIRELSKHEADFSRALNSRFW